MKIIRFVSRLVSLLLVLSAIFFGGYLLSVRFGFIPEPLPVSGTGSMFPTFPKGTGTDSAVLARQIVVSPMMKRFPGGIEIAGRHWFAHTLGYNDIVSFTNDQTREISLQSDGRESGFVKRVVGLPGDRLEIRDGFVWINGERRLEDFTAAARSTFGGKFLADCQTLNIPAGYVFVMGDNRKASNDSRHDIGLVAISDIDHVLPFTEQDQYRYLWRDSARDYLLANRPVLDAGEYLRLLNSKRAESGLAPLKHQLKLDSSSAKRAAAMLKYSDLSFEATRSGLTMERAMAQSGYSNIVWGETPTLGFYNAEELIDNFFQSPQSRNFLLNPDFQDTGLSVEVGEMNGCPTQIVVQHLAGYIPPDYRADVVASWAKALSQLKEVLPGWEEAAQYADRFGLDEEKVKTVADLIRLRISRLEAIVSRMQKNEWLSSQENAWYEEDESLAKKLDTLTQELNNSGH